MVDDFMCSDACPCDRGMQLYMNSLQLERYGANGRSSSASIADNRLVFADPAAGVTAYANYAECYDAIKDSAAAETSSDSADWKEFMQDGGFDFLSAIEEEFDCAGICYNPLFYITKDVAESTVPVTQGCVEAFVERAKDNAHIGAFGVLTGILLWVAATGSCALCSDYAKENSAS